MAQQGDDWQVRIDPLSIPAVAIRLGTLTLAAIYGFSTARWFGAALWSIFALLVVDPSLIQIVITSRQLSVRTWLDRVHRDAGIVRSIGPDRTLALRTTGRVWLLGPDPTLVPLPTYWGLRWWYRRRLVAGCRRAGVAVLDDAQSWRETHRGREQLSNWSRLVGSLLVLSVALPVVILQPSSFDSWGGPAFLLVVSGGLLWVVAFLAGPPAEYRSPTPAPRSE